MSNWAGKEKKGLRARKAVRRWTSSSQRSHALDKYTCWIGFFCIALVLSAGPALAQKVYWADPDTHKIQVGNLDGSGAPTDLFDSGDGLDLPVAVALDVAGGKLYWTEQGASKIQVGNLDGSGAPTDLFDSGDGVISPHGIALDVAGGKVYWTDIGTDGIHVGNLDGSGSPTELFGSDDGITTPLDIALDVAGDKVYWSSSETSGLHVGNLDGSGDSTDLFDSGGVAAGNAHGIALDVASGKIYWASSQARIEVGNMDGSGAPTVLFDSGDGLSNPIAVALDLASGKVYWTDAITSKIQVGNLDGSGAPTDLFDSGDGLASPFFLALDLTTGPQVTSATGGGFAEEGEDVTLSVGITGTTGAVTYEWFKDGSVTPLANGGNISGADTPNLSITSVTMSDGGSYVLEFTDASKATFTALALVVTVVAPSSLPAAGALARALSVAAIVASMLWHSRRRKVKA